MWWRRTGTRDEGFQYLDPGGTPLPAETVDGRLASLTVPPAWAGVHISPDPGRKVQAWGVDAAGRKQYIYSAEHVERRDRRKWGRVLHYGRLIPQLRLATGRHLCRPSPDRDKVLATVVRLMARAYFRVGSERYAVRNRTFGICTLRKSHLEVRDTTLIFTYPGKQRKHQRQVVADTPLVEIVRELLELPGSRLFRYVDDAGRVRNVTARVVNRYIAEILGERCTSKDMRTFGGTLRAAMVLAELGSAASAREAQRNIALCCRLTALELGNTPTICRNAYIHPAVLREYRDAGRTIEPLMRASPRPVSAGSRAEYYPEEAALIRFLERYA